MSGMHLQTGVVVTIFAVATGVAIGRTTAPHGPNPPVLVAGSPSHVSGSADRARTAGASAAYVEGARESAAGDRVAAGHAGKSGDARLDAVVVYVAGAVAKPGVYTLRPTARANEALRAAGGATALADLVAINLAARLEDGEEIAVPIRGAEAGASGDSPPAAKHSRRHSTKRGHRKRHRKSDGLAEGVTDGASAPTEMVDVNEADQATLETLPGVGPSLAERIVAFRNLNGPFASTDELLDVGGMTAGKIDALAPYASFH